ncbi:hypothetical protein BD779DRAFT_55127 [Infundibulicybe gibba]|nr:hypothetical protein BD779DRAFT_55127 [Infundibulicybe gibba]
MYITVTSRLPWQATAMRSWLGTNKDATTGSQLPTPHPRPDLLITGVHPSPNTTNQGLLPLTRIPDQTLRQIMTRIWRPSRYHRGQSRESNRMHQAPR